MPTLLALLPTLLIHLVRGCGCSKELPNLLGLSEVKEIAEHYNKTTAQVLLRHTVQRGLIVIPKSSKAERIRQNIDVSSEDALLRSS